jgi:hypothetical protein
MAIGDDFDIDYVNQRVYNKRAWGLDGTNTVYTVNALYSWLMDTFDELAQMDNPVPMSAQTPTEYTFINQWFIDDESVKYLLGGAIKTSGYLDQIQVLTLSPTGYQNCLYGDIGKMVTDDGANTGNLLAFDNAKRKWWIRWTSAILSASAMRIDGYIPSGKSYNANTAAYTDETVDINSATANDVALPPIQITTVGDAIYVGDDQKFSRWRLNVGTAGVHTGVTKQWQYWNGAWTALTVTDPTNFFTVAGTNNITWTPPADWATTTVDGVTKYWIRCVVTALTTPTLTTAPLGTQGWIGTGLGTAAANSVTGEDLYANVYTLGTITTDPSAQMYVFQAGSRIPEWSSLSNWDRGHIDVLIKVKEAGTEIDGAVVTVFARQYSDLYDNYEIDLTAGGRNAVPIATATDLDNLTGDYYLLYDGEVTAFAVGDVVVGATSGAYAELSAVADWGTTGLLTLRGVRGAFQDNENLQVSGSTKAVANGTLGDTYIAYDAETAGFVTMGQIITGATSGAKRLLRGVQDDGTTGKLVMQVSTTVTGTAKNPYYRTFQDNEVISGAADGSATANGVSTTVVSGYSDVTVAFVNGTVAVGTITGTFVDGERVSYTGGEAILLKAVAGTLTLGNVTNTALNGKVITGDISAASCTASADLVSAHTMNKAFLKQPEYPYDMIIQCGSIYQAGRGVSQVYEYFKFLTKDGSAFSMYTVVAGVITVLEGQEYIIAYAGYSPKKASPLATFAGGVLFGAQGLWIEGMATADVRAYTLLDSNGVKRDPPNLQSLTVTALGQVGAVWDKVSVFQTSAGAINKAQFTSHATANASPSTSFTVVETIPLDTPESGYIRLRKMPTQVEERIAYTSWSGSVFTLAAAHSGGYDGDDTAYVPFIDAQASASSISVTVIYTADRSVLVRVRNKGIIPFEIAATYISVGLTVSAIRTTDAIVT